MYSSGSTSGGPDRYPPFIAKCVQTGDASSLKIAASSVKRAIDDLIILGDSDGISKLEQELGVYRQALSELLSTDVTN